MRNGVRNLQRVCLNQRISTIINNPQKNMVSFSISDKPLPRIFDGIPVIYTVWDSEQPLYVGATRRLSLRIAEHRRIKESKNHLNVWNPLGMTVLGILYQVYYPHSRKWMIRAYSQGEICTMSLLHKPLAQIESGVADLLKPLISPIGAIDGDLSGYVGSRKGIRGLARFFLKATGNSQGLGWRLRGKERRQCDEQESLDSSNL